MEWERKLGERNGWMDGSFLLDLWLCILRALRIGSSDGGLCRIGGDWGGRQLWGGDVWIEGGRRSGADMSQDGVGYQSLRYYAT